MHPSFRLLASVLLITSSCSLSYEGDGLPSPADDDVGVADVETDVPTVCGDGSPPPCNVAACANPPCDPCVENPCPAELECVLLSGTLRECREPASNECGCANTTYWRCDEGDCVDIDECALDPCSDDERCENREGGPARCIDDNSCVVDRDVPEMTCAGNIRGPACADFPGAVATCWRDVLYVGFRGANIDGDGSWDSPFLTIGEALGKVDSGEAIVVGPGTYDEEVLISDKANIWLIGSDPDRTRIASPGWGGIQVLESRDIYVAGFAITDALGAGIFSRDSSNIVVRDVRMRNIGPEWEWVFGILVETTSSAHFSDIDISSVTSMPNIDSGGIIGAAARLSQAITLERVSIENLRAGDGITMGGGATGISCSDVEDFVLADVAVIRMFGGNRVGTGWASQGLELVECPGAIVTGAELTDIFGAEASAPGTFPGRSVGASIRGSDDVAMRDVFVRSIRGGHGLDYDGNAEGIEVDGGVGITLEHVVVGAVQPMEGLAASLFVWNEAIVTVDHISAVGRGASPVVSVVDASLELRHAILSSTSRFAPCFELDNANLQTEHTMASDCDVGDQPIIVGDAAFISAVSTDLRLQPSSDAIDRGSTDPTDFSAEPNPNGCATNLGAYGGTWQATVGEGEPACQ